MSSPCPCRWCGSEPVRNVFTTTAGKPIYDLRCENPACPARPGSSSEIEDWEAISLLWNNHMKEPLGPRDYQPLNAIGGRPA